MYTRVLHNVNATVQSRPSNLLDESASVAFVEKTILVGHVLRGCGWGVLFAVYCQTIMATLNSRNSILKTSIRESWPYFTWSCFLSVFTTILFITGTISLVGFTAHLLDSFIDNRNALGGPSKAYLDDYAIPWNVAGNTVNVIQIILVDALLICRCFVIYSRNPWVIILPLLLLLGCAGTTIAGLVEIEINPGAFSGVNKELGTAFYSFSIALNIIVTTLIVIKLLNYKNAFARVKDLGLDHGKYCVTISAILIESALLNTVSTLVFLIFYARRSPLENVFSGLSGFVQVTASMLIILRVAQGRAWSTTTVVTTLSDVETQSRILVESSTESISPRET